MPQPFKSPLKLTSIKDYVKKKKKKKKNTSIEDYIKKNRLHRNDLHDNK